MALIDEILQMSQWLHQQQTYHRTHHAHKTKKVVAGEVWQCDLGFNIGEEKNKSRPVLVMSNTDINRTGKAIILPITDADGKIKPNGLPKYDSWFLLFADTTDPTKMYAPGRRVQRRATPYTFLDKDSVVQCEEVRSVSKARLLYKRGDLAPSDILIIKRLVKGVFDIS
ncbi:type II toxin-antitoxin system PemK/MazF family toxin [Brevibacillus migulae]|uniref:type II toxin-antitoxin system PemK/MazF family toxin n=1 Tax=Brevibacillus migulae TaxID=1644114 RepID=UPI00106E3132|nr:type II toxin-antitoxin system PemK/MazF family toxin [Brevibacillus migulae]